MWNLFKKSKKKILYITHVPGWLNKYAEKHLKPEIDVVKREVFVRKEKIFELTSNNQDKNVIQVHDFVKDLSVDLKTLNLKNYLMDKSKELDSIKSNLIVTLEDQNLKINLVLRLEQLDKVLINLVNFLEKNQYDTLSKIISLLEEYNSLQDDLKNYQDKMHAVFKEKNQYNVRLEQEKQKQSEIKKSGPYKDLKALEQDLEVKEKELEKAKKSFSSLLPNLLKKLTKVQSKKTTKLNKLLANFEELAYSNLKYLKNLDAKNNLNLNLKELESVVLEKKELEDEIKLLKNRIKNNSATLNLKEFESRINVLKKSIKDCDVKSQKIIDKIDEINIKLVKQKIRDLIKTLDKNVELQLKNE